MSELKNLEGKDAISKLKELATKVKTCLFCTNVKGVPFETRPMATSEVDDDGNIWFLSGKDSNKNREINTQDDKVQLIYSDPAGVDFMTVAGRADVYYDRETIEELWNPIARTYFVEGKDDPSVTVIKVSPEEGYYWDTNHGKMVSLLKMAAGAVAGREMNDGIEGRLDIK
jgi:general stress protein 26